MDRVATSAVVVLSGAIDIGSSFVFGADATMGDLLKVKQPAKTQMRSWR
jgi:hypothetical protein